MNRAQETAQHWRYEQWISRERRIRIEILKSSPAVREKGIYRVCQSCGEVCLCVEQTCPNCNQTRIVEQALKNELGLAVKNRIRCLYRFEHLTS